MQIVFGCICYFCFFKFFFVVVFVLVWIVIGVFVYVLSDLLVVQVMLLVVFVLVVMVFVLIVFVVIDIKFVVIINVFVSIDVVKVKGLVEIFFDIIKVFVVVQKICQEIIDVVLVGDVKKVVVFFKVSQVDFGFDNVNVDFELVFKDMFGDGDGFEVFFIMLDVFLMGYVYVGVGIVNDMYVWFYFMQKDIKMFIQVEKVDLMCLVIVGDFVDMQEYGSYNFYCVGIVVDGKLKQFMLGN